MVGAISAISSYQDPEYMRIIQELLALGLTPTGNKNVDAATLASAKQKVQNKQNDKFSLQVNKNTTSTDKSKQEAAEKMEGATILSEINKVMLGLI